MTIEEALAEIRSQPKWYLTPDGKDNLLQMAQRIEDGRCKPETVNKFFTHFGYTVEVNMEVNKI